MASERPSSFRPLSETVEFKTAVLNILESTAKVAKPVAEVVAFAGAVIGLFKILKGDKTGAVISIGASLIALTASKGLENFSDKCGIAVEKWEDTPTN